MHTSLLWRGICLIAYATIVSCLVDRENHQDRLSHSRPRRVAIIGAGAAGTSAAYHLRQFALAQDVPVDITVYERRDYVGGRSTTVAAYGDSVPIELGASIFVDVNYILKNASAEFGLRPKASETESNEFLGIWDGERFVFTQEEADGWRNYLNIGKILWKYGLAPIRTQRLSRKIVNRFLRLYEAPWFPFRSLSERALDLDLVEVSAVTGEELLEANQIGQGFGTDIIQASTRVNYGQNLRHVNGLISMVCMAIEGAMQIEGGNWQIFDRMLTLSNATTYLNTTVAKIVKRDGLYHLEATKLEGSTRSQHTSDFDTVILAGPYQFSKIDFTDAELDHVPDEVPYVKLHVTLFASPHRLNPVFFGLKPGDRCPDTILTTLQPNDVPLDRLHPVGKPNFFSISTLRTVVNPRTFKREYLYKIFSPEKVEAAFLSGILGAPVPPDLDHISPSSGEAITWYHAHVWDAYPFDFPRVTFAEPVLARAGAGRGGGGAGNGGGSEGGVYYTGAMDTFISTMETNALMGKNVARLVVEDALAERVGKQGEMGERAKEDQRSEDVGQGDVLMGQEPLGEKYHTEEL